MNIFAQWFADNKLFLLLAVGTLFGYFWLYQFKEKLNISDLWAFLLSVVHTVIGVLCVKVFAFLEAGEAGGMSLYGAIFFLPAVYFAGAKIFKRKPALVFDVFTVNMVFTLMCARVNCLLSGCCQGKLIPGTADWRWPTRELEILFYIALLIWLGRKVGKAKYSGRIYPLYMMAYGIFRFAVEWLRESDYIILGFMHIAHIWSLVALAVGAVIYYMPRFEKKKGGEKRRRPLEKN